MGKATLIHNRKLSILHLFAAVVIQFLSFPLTASFAFSISEVYFLFEDRVTTVIPFVPLLPNGKNKCLLCVSFSKECFSSFSLRIQPDFIRSYPGRSSFGFFFFHESWNSEHLQRNTIKTSRNVSRKLKPNRRARTAPEAENTIWTDKQPSGFIDPKSQINSNRWPETGSYTQKLRHLVPELKRFHPAAEEISSFCRAGKNNNGQDISPSSSTPPPQHTSYLSWRYRYGSQHTLPSVHKVRATSFRKLPPILMCFWQNVLGFRPAATTPFQLFKRWPITQ